jgi:uncharacterized protein (TIGR03437 family)
MSERRHSRFTQARAARATFLITLLAIGSIIWRLSGSRAAAVVQNSVPVSSVSAASFTGGPAPLAPNSIVAGFGTQLATGTLAASTQPLPTSLGGTTVTVNGVAAPLFFVSPNQVNFLAPPGVAAGDAQVVITSPSGGDQIVSRGTMRMATVAPAIFTANANGTGVPAAVTGRVNAGGQFVFDPAPPFEPNPLQPGQFLPAPIDVGTAQQPAFLILFATGLRNAAAGSTRAIIGGVEVPVTPVAAPGFTGLDQVNLQLPVSLKGQGIVDVTLVSNGVSSNPVQVNLAGAASGVLAISGFSTTAPAIAGQTVTISGNGFSTAADQNLVRFGAAQGRVIAASASQLSVIVPFGAESSRVVVQTPQGEVRSGATFQIRTSVSGLVQSTGTTTGSPVPLPGVTVRVVGTNLSVQTNPQGTFVIPNLNPGVEFLEVDGGTTGVNPPFPKVTLKATIRADRDNQFTQAISLQQATGGSGNVGTAAKESPLTELGQKLNAAIHRARRVAADERQAAPGDQTISPLQLGPLKTVVISSGGVSLEVPIGTNVRFPDGKTAGQMQLTVVNRSRLPGVSLPIGVYSPLIAQVTPLGTTFSPGASISFPNPDQTRLGPGAKADLYRYDFQTGLFVRRGTGTVSADRARIVSDGRVVDVASFWLVSAGGGVTSVRGRVIDAQGAPVAGAKVSVNGRWNSTDTNGGFNISDVGTLGVQQVQAEAVLPRQYGTPPRGTSAITNVVTGGVTNVGNIALSNTNQAALVLSPFNIDFDSTSPPARMEVTLTQAAPAGGLVVQLLSDATAVATVPASVTIPAGQTTVAFNVTRTGPGVAFLEARATLAGGALSTIAVATVSAPAPQLAGVTPASGPPGARILIGGTGFTAIANRNIVGFVRNNNLVAVLDPDENQVVTDEAGRISLRVAVPPIAAGVAGIVVATIDRFTGIISDTSAPLNFTVLASNVPTPQLASITPTQGKARDAVTINGVNFSPVAAENQIVFRQGLDESPARILRATATQIVAEVPAQDLSKGDAVVLARRRAANGAVSNASNALDFRITEDPGPPVRPTIASAVNASTNQSSGRDGDVIRLTGTNFGRNFYDVETDDVGNDEPVITLLLYFQNNQLLNFSLPVAAQGGTQISTVLPSGLAAGPVQIFAINFDLESGLNSDESNPAAFNITLSSIRRIDEDEPNDTVETATEVFLPLIVDGRASKDDPSELSIRFNDGTSENLPDLFALSLDQTTAVAITLNLTLPADLDLFVLRENADGSFSVIGSSTRTNSAVESLTGNLLAGEYLVAIGAFSGSSRYSLALAQGAPTFGVFSPPAHPFEFRVPVAVERLNR